MKYKYSYIILDIFSGNYFELQSNTYYGKGYMYKGCYEVKECISYAVRASGVRMY